MSQQQTPDAEPSPDTSPDTDEEASQETTLSQAAIQVTSQDGNDERGTPVEFVRKLQNAIGGKFDLDPCSGAEPQPIAENRFTKEDNGLAQDWTGYETVYVNPPYSELKKWLQKVNREYSRDSSDAPGLIMCLLPGNTSTEWFQDYATLSEYLCLIKGRLTFNGTDQSAPFASILVVYGDPDQDVLDTLNNLGTVYTKAEIQTASRQSRLDELIQADGGGTTVISPPSESTGANAELDRTRISGGGEIRDVSSEAPAVPQGVIDFNDVGIGDEFNISFDTSTLGYPSELPSEMRMKVITGERATSDRTQTPDEWRTVTCINDEKEIWVVLSQDPDDISDIRCTVSYDTVSWTDVAFSKLYRIATYNSRAINPHGEGTSYIC